MPDNRHGKGHITLPAGERLDAYGARRFIGTALEKRLNLQSRSRSICACFAVVDYDAHTETLAPPARWDPKRNTFVDLEDGSITEPSTILDTILPLPVGNAKPRARALVSTRRKNYETIPRSALLAEIGRRVRNVRNYEQALGTKASQLPKFTEFEEAWLSDPQPFRTDCEHVLSGADFVDVEFES